MKMATVKKDNKKKIIIAVSVILVIAILGTVIGVAAAKNKKETVTLATIGTGNINETVSATGTVESGTTKEYKVGSVATVKEVLVKVGDTVKAGDMLATFDTSTLDSQISQLNDSYNKAKKSYQDSVSAQKDAKKQISEINNEIADLQATVQKLGGNNNLSYLLENSSSKSASSYAAQNPIINVSELITLIDSFSDDSEQSNKIIQIVMETISNEIANGNLSSEEINKAVENAILQAIKDGTIDSGSLNFTPEEIARQIENALSGIDWSGINSDIANSDTVKLSSAQIRLISLYAQQQMLELQASDTTVTANKQIMETSKSALDTIKESSAELSAGWSAAFDGTVTECNIYPGEQTTLLTSGITIQNLNSMVINLSLGEYDVHKVKVGMPATISTAYGTYTGTVLSKTPIASGGSSGSLLDSVGSMAGISGLSSLTSSGAGVQVQVGIDNADENIIAGFDADVEIEVGDYNNITVVPIESIILEKTGTYVYLYSQDDKTVTKTLIETGAVSDSAYQVTSGLKPGDKIIATPSSDYTEDTFEVNVKSN
ncbi:MAG: biotin/lipoyl-binding protein [Clostridiales bacterium]|nr:biotin/lipoyl-binding protein [Clostridiales bacterium]